MFKQNIKNICFALIAIGIVAIGYGFYSASASHYSDIEIKEKVKELYYKLNSSKSFQLLLVLFQCHNYLVH